MLSYEPEKKQMIRFYLYTFFAFMLLSRGAKAQATDTLFIQMARLKLARAHAYTLELASRMPAEKYGFKPSSGQMSFAGQLLHLAQNLAWLSSSYLDEKQRNPLTKADGNLEQKDSILTVVNRTYHYALRTLEHFRPPDLTDTVSFFAGPMNKLQIINLINDHQSHHRGQLIVYLRMNGITPPPYVGW
jgi:uncharacterized damage-inducible protein DinB